MKADRARASASSVLDALGGDFWSWWRTTVGGAVLANVVILVLAATNISVTGAFLEFGMVSCTFLLGCGVGVVTYLASKRSSRWQQMQTERRLPAQRSSSSAGPMGLLLAGTLAWVILTVGGVYVAFGPKQDAWATATPWMLAVLVVGAAGAALGRWDRGWLSRLGALIVVFLYLGSWDFVADSVRAVSTTQCLAIGGAALTLLVWSFRRPTPMHAKPNRMGLPTWRSLAYCEPLLLAWYRERFKGALGLLFGTFLGAGSLIGPFVPGALHFNAVGYWLMFQVMVLWLSVAAWHVPEQHWRYRLLPNFARRRYCLALKLWWAQLRWMVPFGLVFALLRDRTLHGWPERSDAHGLTMALIQGLPWLLANLALLTAIATLWVGLRRIHRRWDWLFAPLWLCAFPVWSWIRREPDDLFIDWSGRLDVLTGLLVSTLFFLAVATWVWQRGSLAGMERWSAAGQSARS